jgi:hypothetical protein
MAAKKQNLANALLNAVLRGATYTGTPVYIALFTTSPTATTAGTEVVGGGYLRVAVTFNPAAAGTTTNTGAVVFPAATAPWGNIVSAVLYNDATAGEQLYFGNLSTFKSVGIGDQITFAAGALSVSES